MKKPESFENFQGFFHAFAYNRAIIPVGHIMSQIFISYSHKDKEYVHKLQLALTERGIHAWIDDRIDYDTDWPE